VIAGMDLTGLGLSFAQAVAALGEQSLFISLLLTALGCLILGMGMPTLPAYLIIVLVMGPALASFDVPIVAAHLFVLYFGVLSAVTPPVAIAAFAAAPLADANPVKVSLVSMRLTMVGFVVPFLFVFNPSLLLIGDHFEWGPLVWGVARIILVIWALTTAFAGFGAVRLSRAARVLRFIIAGLLLAKGTSLELIGFAMALLTLGASYLPPLTRRWAGAAAGNSSSK